MSHEIRTPLNGIIGFADLLRRGADRGDAHQRAEWIGIIHGSGTHLLSLLNDVLDLAKLDVGKMDVAPGPCSPRAVISESVLILKSKAEEKGLTVELVFDPEVPEGVRTDATRVRQIVMNLMGNAVKFTERGGVKVRVGFQARQDGAGTLSIEVVDTGIGMTREQAEQVFAPFEQADHTIATRFGGTGLGLAISRNLARRLGGDISVVSEPGGGSTFTAYFSVSPLLRGESLPSANPAREGSGAPGLELPTPLRGRRVLVVDDVEANRQVCSIFLERAGAKVSVACDGREAVEMCRGRTFDLVLMDIQMPEMNGNDAARAMRAAGFEAPIIALTAFSAGADRGVCLGAGMNDFLSKPIDADLLIGVVGRWVREGGGAVDGPESSSERTMWQEDPDLEPVARAWLAELPLRLDEILAAIARKDGTGAARGAHAIKGSGGTLGMPEFTEPAEQLEAASKSARFDEAERWLTTLKRLQAAAAAPAQRRAA